MNIVCYCIDIPSRNPGAGADQARAAMDTLRLALDARFSRGEPQARFIWLPDPAATPGAPPGVLGGLRELHAHDDALAAAAATVFEALYASPAPSTGAPA